ncbi:MAG: hypothetical protein M3433_03205 [Actinomycetota bacterium]|nr:hypothetical protein [Actinomycetota bacterium]
MAELVESYILDGERHRIELVPAGGGARLLLDREGAGAPRVIAELGADEGDEWVHGLLYGEGAYLERALSGERGLGVRLGKLKALQREAQRAAREAA